jgi:hypothetical protein
MRRASSTELAKDSPKAVDKPTRYVMCVCVGREREREIRREEEEKRKRGRAVFLYFSC